MKPSLKSSLVATRGKQHQHNTNSSLKQTDEQLLSIWRREEGRSRQPPRGLPVSRVLKAFAPQSLRLQKDRQPFCPDLCYKLQTRQLILCYSVLSVGCAAFYSIFWILHWLSLIYSDKADNKQTARASGTIMSLCVCSCLFKSRPASYGTRSVCCWCGLVWWQVHFTCTDCHLTHLNL